MVKAPAFDAKALSDDELVVLESTLRVQIAVATHVRVLQVTALVSGAVVTAGLSTLLAGPSIVCSAALHHKCKKRHRACCRELRARNVGLAPVHATKFAKRALALSVAGGLTCCVLGVALDILFDESVLQVVAFFFSTVVENHITEGTTGFVLTRAADILGRDHVYVLDAKPVGSVDEMRADKDHSDAANGAEMSKKRGSSLVERTQRYWKSASWSFSTQEMQTKIRDAKRAFRHRPSLQEGVESDHNDATDDWKHLFSDDNNDYNDSEDGRPAYETLFGCCIRTSTTVPRDDNNVAVADHVDHVELVRTDAFNLFGECFVVRVRTRTESFNSQVASTMFNPSDSERAPYESHVECTNKDDDIMIQQEHRRAQNSELLFAGDSDACAFWGTILKPDAVGSDVIGSQDDWNDDVSYGVDVWSYDDDEEPVEEDDERNVFTMPMKPRSPAVSAVAEAYALFGVPEGADVTAVPSARPVCRPSSVEMAKDEDATDAFNLFGIATPHLRLQGQW